MNTPETSRWEPVKDLMAGAASVALGSMHAYHMAKTPRRMLYTLSYYKFAAKMIGKREDGSAARILDIGCGEGLGTWLLAAECGYARGVDFDADLIATAQRNWPADRASFACADVLAMEPEPYDAAVNFDVIEHILPDHADAFLAAMAANLTPHGIAIVGTPNITSRPYASAVTNAGHVNLYDAERLEAQMRRRFRQVFMFGANDEIVHTGFAPMCHYLIALGAGVR
jgi:2-polyprenyl-3-methyl-5-hydroxy-6-metoxy-1,4-benzoquinol methylase